MWPSQISGTLSCFSEEFIRSQYSEVEKQVMFAAVFNTFKHHVPKMSSYTRRSMKTTERLHRTPQNSTAEGLQIPPGSPSTLGPRAERGRGDEGSSGPSTCTMHAASHPPPEATEPPTHTGQEGTEALPQRPDRDAGPYSEGPRRSRLPALLQGLVPETKEQITLISSCRHARRMSSRHPLAPGDSLCPKLRARPSNACAARLFPAGSTAHMHAMSTATSLPLMREGAFVGHSCGHRA